MLEFMYERMLLFFVWVQVAACYSIILLVYVADSNNKNVIEMIFEKCEIDKFIRVSVFLVWSISFEVSPPLFALYHNTHRLHWVRLFAYYCVSVCSCEKLHAVRISWVTNAFLYTVHTRLPAHSNGSRLHNIWVYIFRLCTELTGIHVGATCSTYLLGFCTCDDDLNWNHLKKSAHHRLVQGGHTLYIR